MQMNKRLFVFFSLAIIGAGLLGFVRVRAFQGNGRVVATTESAGTVSVPPKATLQAIKSATQNTTTRRGLFVISSVNGETVCRIPTADEASSLFQRDPKT